MVKKFYNLPLATYMLLLLYEKDNTPTTHSKNQKYPFAMHHFICLQSFALVFSPMSATSHLGFIKRVLFKVKFCFLKQGRGDVLFELTVVLLLIVPPSSWQWTWKAVVFSCGRLLGRKEGRSILRRTSTKCAGC